MLGTLRLQPGITIKAKSNKSVRLTDKALAFIQLCPSARLSARGRSLLQVVEVAEQLREFFMRCFRVAGLGPGVNPASLGGGGNASSTHGSSSSNASQISQTSLALSLLSKVPFQIAWQDT